MNHVTTLSRNVSKKVNVLIRTKFPKTLQYMETLSNDARAFGANYQQFSETA